MCSITNKKHQKNIKIREYNKEITVTIDYDFYKVYVELIDELDGYIKLLYKTVYLGQSENSSKSSLDLINMHTRTIDNVFRKLLVDNFFTELTEFNLYNIKKVFICIFYIVIKFTEDEVLSIALLKKYTGISQTYLVETESKIWKILGYDLYKYVINTV